MARSSKQKQVEEGGLTGDEWLTSYGDLVTLLLVFFVVLYSMANTDLKNFEKIALSLRAAFNNSGEVTTAVIGEANGVTSSGQMASAPLFTDKLPTKHRDFVRVSTELATFAQQLGVAGEISINMNLEGIIISLSENLVFEPGSADLRPEAEEVLNHVANILQEIDNPVRVEGHTDDVPTNSPLYPSNWELSVMRSVTVVRYLTEELGIAPERFTAAGSAEFKPLVPNTSRENRAMNRRADIIIIYPGESRQFSISLPNP
jgi:chemotaxis protein MotB